MTSLRDVTDFLDLELNIAEIPDYSEALNGLQIENGGEVTKIASAVDASLQVFEKAVSAGADMLLVHHGMFWQGSQRLTGPVYRRVKTAIDAGMALYSAHIPLDVHPVWGNNALLASGLGMQEPEAFFDWRGIKLGLRQELEVSVEELHAKLAATVGIAQGGVHLCPGGSERAGMVGIITGGAGSQVAEIAECGIDTFITGEGPHWSYTLAEELGLNVFYAGHYATETFGVRGLANELGRKFGIEAIHVDHPTGL